MTKCIKIMLILALTAGCLSVCVEAAMRINDFAQAAALNRAVTNEAVKLSDSIVTRNLGELKFNAIDASSTAHVTVRSASDAGRDVIVRVNANLAGHVEVGVRDGVLEIGLEKTSFKGLRNITFEVSVPACGNLKSLKATGAAAINVLSPQSCDALNIVASGASNINMEARVDCRTAVITATGASKISGSGGVRPQGKCTIESRGASDVELAMLGGQTEIEASGAGKAAVSLQGGTCRATAGGASKITLSGRCDKLYAGAVGGSKTDASECESAVCSAEASGASKVMVWCTGTLNAEATGASKVAYRGDCRVESSTLGASSVKRME